MTYFLVVAITNKYCVLTAYFRSKMQMKSFFEYDKIAGYFLLSRPLILHLSAEDDRRRETNPRRNHETAWTV